MCDRGHKFQRIVFALHWRNSDPNSSSSDSMRIHQRSAFHLPLLGTNT
jgi:hypothetical protein